MLRKAKKMDSRLRGNDVVRERYEYVSCRQLQTQSGSSCQSRVDIIIFRKVPKSAAEAGL